MRINIVYQFSLIILVLFFGCSEIDLEERREARLELALLGYSLNQTDFTDIVSNNDITLIDLFIKSGFKPNRESILNLMDEITASTLEEILKNHEEGELDGRKEIELWREKKEVHFLEEAAALNNYDMLEVFWSKGVRLPEYPYKLVGNAISSGHMETLQFLHDKNFNFRKQLYDGNDTERNNDHFLPLAKSIEKNYFSKPNYEVVEFLLKIGCRLDGWNRTNSEGNKKSLNEVYSETISSDLKLAELFDKYHN